MGALICLLALLVGVISPVPASAHPSAPGTDWKSAHESGPSAPQTVTWHWNGRSFDKEGTISVTPSSGLSGATVTVTGSGFTPSDYPFGLPIQVNVDHGNGHWELLATVATAHPDANGNINLQIQIPSSAPAGLLAISALTGSGASPSASFNSTGIQGSPSEQLPTAFSVDRAYTTDGTPNEQTNFKPGDLIWYVVTVNITGGSAHLSVRWEVAGPQRIYDFTNDGLALNPGYQAAYSPSTIPKDAPAGTYTLTATVSFNGQTAVRSAIFDVGLAHPNFALPFPPGTKVHIGRLGLHDDNFRNILDDQGGVYNFNNNKAPVSLDFIPENSGVPVTAISDGLVLAVWSKCTLVLVDHGANTWGAYLHLREIKVRSGQSVKRGDPLGYPSAELPSASDGCGAVHGDVAHLHFALLAGSGHTGTFTTLLGQSFCGHDVSELDGRIKDIGLPGLTSKANEIFSVPHC